MRIPVYRDGDHMIILTTVYLVLGHGIHLSFQRNHIQRNGTSCTSPRPQWNGRSCEKHKTKLDTQVTELDMEVMDDGEAVRVGSYLVSSIVQSSQT